MRYPPTHTQSMKPTYCILLLLDLLFLVLHTRCRICLKGICLYERDVVGGNEDVWFKSGHNGALFDLICRSYKPCVVNLVSLILRVF